MDQATKILEVRAFVERGNFHAAYNIALSALHQCDREGDQRGVERFIALIREIVEALARQYIGESRD